ncbi:MAG: lysylphosphatidylglycerol synthase transmembrane domain-containing protein [Candidatus Sericytochromatia bacterium]|nr:lysylphosphatidylglycerol synthase transmembrane domain-containing protein [Candidatus Sericytochromatia bacterium]
MFGKKSNLIGLALSGICLFLVFRKVDTTRLLASLSGLNVGYLLAALGVFLSTFLVRALRWKTLLSTSQALPTRQVLGIVMIGYMANNLLPARLGEFVRAYVLRVRTGIRKSTSLATILVERIFDGLSLLFILGALLLAHKLGWLSLKHDFPDSIQWAGGFAGAVFVSAFAVLLALEMHAPLGDTIRGLLRKWLPDGLATRLCELLDAFVEGIGCVRNAGVMAFVMGASLLIWSIEGVTYALVGQAFHLELPLRAFLITMVIVNLGTLIPSAPGFIGTFQLFCWISLGLFAIPKETAVSYGLVLNLLEYLPVTIIGVACLLAMNLSFRSVVRGQNQPEPEGNAT